MKYLVNARLNETLETVFGDLERQVLTNVLGVFEFLWDGLQVIVLDEGGKRDSHLLECKVFTNAIAGSNQIHQIMLAKVRTYILSLVSFHVAYPALNG